VPHHPGRIERLLICVLAFFLVSAAGIVVRVMIGPVYLVPFSELAWTILLWSLVPGLVAAALAARFPAVFRPIASLFPDIGG
jgi:hypothetical protein